MERYHYNQDWYAIKYGLAALKANRWVREDERLHRRVHQAASPLVAETASDPRADRGDVDALRADAFEQATTLSLDCFLALEVLGRRRWFGRLRRQPVSARRYEILKSYLRDAMLPASLVLLAGVTRRPDRVSAPEREAPATDADPPGGSEPQGADAPPQQATAGEAVDRTQAPDVEARPAAPPKAYENNPDLVRRAVETRSADPVELIAYVRALPRRDARVDYNLACAYAVAANESVARQMLYDSLIATPVARRPGLAQRAVRDPTLANVIQALDGTGDAERVLEMGRGRRAAGGQRSGHSWPGPSRVARALASPATPSLHNEPTNRYAVPLRVPWVLAVIATAVQGRV